MRRKGFLPVYVELFRRYLRGFPLVLDAGCGYGRMFEFFPSFCGVDIKRVRLKRSKFPNMICCADLNVLPFKDKAFPASCTNQVLMHISPEQIRNVLSELDRVTEERLVHIEYYNRDKPLLARRSYNHDLEKLYEPLGWKMVCYKIISHVHPTHGCWVFEK